MLLDTAVLEDYWRGDPGAQEVLGKIIDGTVAASISTLSLFELWSAPGLDRRTEIGLIAVLNFLEVVPMSLDVAREAGIAIGAADPDEREWLRRFAMIGATARHRGEPVCTRDETSYRKFSCETVRY